MKMKNAPAISDQQKRSIPWPLRMNLAARPRSPCMATSMSSADKLVGEPIEGQYILLSEFLEDLKQISSAKHHNCMNSYGGDAEPQI